MLSLLLTDDFIKIIFLGVIVFIAFILQCAMLYSLWRNRRTIDFLSAIKRGNRISKAGLFFFVLMAIIAYQALFIGKLSDGLVELMMVIVGGDLGATWMANNNNKFLGKKINDGEE